MIKPGWDKTAGLGNEMLSKDLQTRSSQEEWITVTGISCLSLCSDLYTCLTIPLVPALLRHHYAYILLNTADNPPESKYYQPALCTK